MHDPDCGGLGRDWDSRRSGWASCQATLGRSGCRDSLEGDGRSSYCSVGATVGADEALRLGLVSRVVPAADLMAEARNLAGELAQNPPIAMRYIIDAVNKGLEMPYTEAAAYEATLFGLLASTDDMREGTKAFLEKRKAEFKGR